MVLVFVSVQCAVCIAPIAGCHMSVRTDQASSVFAEGGGTPYVPKAVHVNVACFDPSVPILHA